MASREETNGESCVRDLLEYRDMGNGYFWITTDGEAFKYFIQAEKHQLSLGENNDK